MAERLRASEGRTRWFWLLMAGATLGGGVWSMHFSANDLLAGLGAFTDKKENAA